ncbi:MAG TPA: class I SAM-dependent methyltransferase [Fimbriimonadaceae bacterium]|nr:class I SAM-dependent methyltransferase [Fimbriimonadaceae bacterium]HRJ33980.1 class I SAM-dependent methyltransferase [Fimbriimonadaceae bacterium]
MDERYGDSDRAEVRAWVPERARKILDVGCWRGAFGAALKAERSAEVWGIELEPEPASVAATRLDRVLVGDALQIFGELPREAFDAVCFNDVLEHLPRPELALDAVRPILSPNGVLVAAIPNIRYVHEFQRLALGKDFPMEDSGIFDRTHLHFFTKLSIQRFFDQHSYQIHHLVGVNPTLSRKFALLNRLLLNRLEDMRWLQYVVVAQPKPASAA